MKNRIKALKRDEGSALALVLFFIILISLWLGSVALLTQSSSSAIKTNIAESQKRSEYVDIGVKAALQELTPDPECLTGIIDDKDSYDSSCRRGTLFQPCSSETFFNRLEGVLASTEIKVRCGQSTSSGIESSLGSLLLLGDGTDCTNCVVGKDGGLSIAASGASDPTVPACSSTTGSSSRYTIFGSVINLAGRWSGVDCTDFQILKSSADLNPKIFQPKAGEAYCPSTFSPCVSLSEWGGKASGIGSVSSLNLSKYSKVNAFVNYTASKLDPFPTNPATVTPSNANCSSSFNTSFSGKKSIIISPGYISNETPSSTNQLTLSRLNELTKSCGDGSSIGGPAVVFQPGAYGFIGSSTPGSNSSNTWSVNYSGSITGSVFAGLPNWEQDGTNFDAPCGTGPVSSGVRFLFKNYSYVELKRGKFIACASSIADPRGAGYDPIVTQPIFSAPAKNSYSNQAAANFWWGSASGSTNSSDAFYTSAQGNNSGGGCAAADVCANFVGSIFAPASWLNISLNGTTITTFKKGMFVKALTITQTGSGPPTKWVDSPGFITNGDRQVQLNFFRRSTGQFLGSVQLKIDDSYGDKLASGYIRKAWRVGW